MSAPPDPALRTLSSLLTSLGVDPRADAIDEHFSSHPDYPSLAAFSDALNAFGIEHDAIQVPVEQLSQLPRPHLAHFDSEDFVVVERMDEKTVFMDGARSLPLERYLSLWSGVVLVPTGRKAPTASSETKAVGRGPRSLAFALLVLGALLSLGFSSLAHAQNGAFFALLALTGAGFVLSALLTAESFGLQTAAQKLCRSGAKTSCASVLQSRASKLGPFSMADIGLGYFGGSALVLVLAASNESALCATIGLLGWLALLSLPYTIFSIAYQGTVVKRWCPLCLGIQALLWAEVVVLWASGAWGPQWSSPVSAASTLALFPMPFALWLLAKPVFERSLELRTTKIDLERLIRDPTVIRSVIALEAEADRPSVPLEIAYGPEDAPVTATIYTDPTCSFCRVRHGELEAALALSEGGLRLVVRVIGPMEEDAETRPLLRALAADLAKGEHGEAHERLAVWFRTRSPVASPDPISAEAEQLLKAHRTALEAPPFAATPIVFVGDRRWPQRLPLRSVGYLARAELEEL